VGSAVTLLSAVAAVATIPSTATSLALMLGLSCGIDYALFILSRHRNQLLLGMPIEDSVPLAVGTAGSSVVFAALTVIVALCGLSVAGIPFLTAMGLSAAGSVLIGMLIALTLLPALLGFAGDKVAKFLASPLRPGHYEQVAQLGAHHPDRTLGAAWARFVVRFRVPVLLGGVALLVVIAVPFTHLQLGLPSGASQPKDNTARKAYDLTAKNFGPGFNGPLLVVADLSRAKSPQAVSQIAATLRTQPDVVVVAPTVQQNAVAVISVVPKTGPNDQATSHLVSRIRAQRASIEAATGVPILVGGTTASNIDTSSKLSSALPVFVIVVVGLAFVLLTFAFRTILVPINSIIGFLLSVCAAFGAEVVVFQWGWAAGLLGVTQSETVSFLPIIVLAIIFGLSSDYEVFVVSRVKEEFSRSGDARDAVTKGISTSTRVVTAAALIMFGVFVAFLTGSDPIIKALGFTLAVGVLLDAFVVRLTLVPAIMAIVGSKLWYHAAWFEKYVPDPDIEGRKLEDMLVAASSGVDPELVPSAEE
jgi:RND superfamily putative drug exporter